MYRYSYILGLILILCGCELTMLSPLPITTPNPSTLPRIELSQLPGCSNGCWDGLKPGFSTSDDIDFYFRQNVQINPDHYHRQYDLENTERYVGVHNGNFGINAIIENGLLKIVIISGPLNLRLAEIIDVVGTPNNVIAYVSPSATARDTYDVIYRIFYPEYGYIFDFNLESGIQVTGTAPGIVNVCLDDSILVANMRLVEPGTLTDVIMNGRSSLYPNFTDDELKSITSRNDTPFKLGCMETTVST